MNIEELVDLCKKGDEQALNLLYTNYSGKMMKVCLHYVPETAVAQDLLHDGFIIIFSSIHALRNAAKLESWMKTIMKNLSLRYINQINTDPTIPLTDICEKEEPVDDSHFLDFISYDRMLDMVENLPAGYAKVFKLAVLEGLSHKEIGELLGIAPHSSSSQLSRAKALLKKMLDDYRVVIILVMAFFFPALYDYLHHEKKTAGEMRLYKTPLRQAEVEKESEKVNNAQGRRKPRYLVPLSTALPLSIPEMRDTINGRIIMNPFTVPTLADERTASAHPLAQTLLPRKKKSGKWKFMLAGSIGPQLAQSLYKLMATPQAISDLPQQVSTWEEYYSYLNTRYQQGMLGNDSIGLMQVAGNNSGKIVEHQHHYAPITIGLSLNKKLNEHWSLETGVQYSYLKSEFTTGEEFRIMDTQKLHYVGIPLRLSYRFWNYKHFSCYTTAGVQIDIPVKGTLQSFHTTDSIPMPLGRQSLTAPIQWSVNTSIGVQYHITPRASIYLEPTINYYIPDGSNLRTIRKEHPFTFTVPVGIRFSW